MIERIPDALPPAMEGNALIKTSRKISEVIFGDYYRDAESEYQTDSIPGGDPPVDQITCPNVNENKAIQNSTVSEESDSDQEACDGEDESVHSYKLKFVKKTQNNSNFKSDSIDYSNLRAGIAAQVNNRAELLPEVNKNKTLWSEPKILFGIIKEQIGLREAMNMNNSVSNADTGQISGNNKLDLTPGSDTSFIIFNKLSLTDEAEKLNELPFSELKIQIAKSFVLNSAKPSDLVTNINQNNVNEQNNSLINSLTKIASVEIPVQNKSNENDLNSRNQSNSYGKDYSNKTYINKELNVDNKANSARIKGNNHLASVTIEKYINSGNIFTSQASKSSSKATLNLAFQNVKLMEFTHRTLQILNNINGSGIGKARLILNPPSLGTIFVEFSLDKSLLKMNIKADNQEVVRVIESQIAVLKEKLANSGIKAESVEVRLRENDDSTKGYSQNYLNKRYSESKGENDLKRTFAESFRLLREERQLDEQDGKIL